MSLVCFKEPSVTMLVTSSLDEFVRKLKKRTYVVMTMDVENRPMAICPKGDCDVCYVREASVEEVEAFKEMKKKQKEEREKAAAAAGDGQKKRIEQPKFTVPGRRHK